LHDLTSFLESVRRILDRHRLETPGAYARWTLPGPEGPRDGGANPYGCADAANILYTLTALPRDEEERRGFVATLQGFQDPADGLFHEATHHPIHTTAHCLAALELFDAPAAAPLAGLAPLLDPAAMEDFLDGLDWSGNPWIEAHRGAGLYAALWLSGETRRDWEDRYFTWLERAVDPATGLLRRGYVSPSPQGDLMRFPQLAGTFHYLFNLEHARRPHPHPEALVDTCLDIEARALFPLATFVGFAEIDWVYCLNRALQQCDHRRAEARAALRRMAARHCAFLFGLDPETDAGLDDLHSLFGTLCALAELQQALPGELRSERPLRLVLDRRPFI
jgi:hypothetical protein